MECYLENGWQACAFSSLWQILLIKLTKFCPKDKLGKLFCWSKQIWAYEMLCEESAIGKRESMYPSNNRLQINEISAFALYQFLPNSCSIRYETSSIEVSFFNKSCIFLL